MKHLKTLLIFVLTLMVFSTNYAASVANGVYAATSETWHSLPKNKVKKEKLHKKDKTFKKQVFKKLLGGGDGSGFNIAGFILGVLGLMLCWVPYLGLVLCLLGVIFGGIGIKKRLKGLGIAGFVAGLIGLIIAFIVTLAVSI